jgi:hypothetical protein
MNLFEIMNLDAVNMPEKWNILSEFSGTSMPKAPHTIPHTYLGMNPRPYDA